jgi:TatD DNase family protein
MTLIDTHTHLFGEAFEADRTEVIERAIAAGVEKMLLPNIDVDSIEPLYRLCDQFPKNCFPMMGLHPGSVDQHWERSLEEIRKNLFGRKNLAVGEIGMDLYWDKAFIEEQKEAFRRQVIWAKELSLPIVIHARDAFEEIFEIVDELNDADLKGVFHCFTGNAEQAQHIINYGGFYFGIGGVVTYKTSELPFVLQKIPLEKIVLETDSPYLPPVPFRGKRNESSYLLHIAEKLSEVYQIKLKDLAERTSSNAQNLFNLSPTINQTYQTINS